MLARANRVTHPEDFRLAIRNGRRVKGEYATLHVVARGDGQTRFGFIVPKTVGGAVTRNLVKRRLRAVCRELLPGMDAGTDVVVRALPGSSTSPWASLREEIQRSASRGVTGR